MRLIAFEKGVDKQKKWRQTGWSGNDLMLSYLFQLCQAKKK